MLENNESVPVFYSLFDRKNLRMTLEVIVGITYVLLFTHVLHIST